MSVTPKNGGTHDPDPNRATATELSGDDNDNDNEHSTNKNNDSTLSHRVTKTNTTTNTTTTTKPIKHSYPRWQNLVAGGVAGAGARLFTAPLDLIRIRAQLERRDVYPRPSILTRMVNIYNAEGGITALFRGNLAASYLWVGYTMVQFAVYGSIKETLEDCRDEIQSEIKSEINARGEQQEPPSRSPSRSQPGREQFSKLVGSPAAVAFVSGAVGGVCATMATYPFDICRTVFASRGASTTEPPIETPATRVHTHTRTAGNTTTTTTFRPPSTIKECAVSMYRKDGIRGFYAGSAPAVVQIVPYMGLNFAIYDFLVTQGEKDGSNKTTTSKSIGLSGYAGSISGAVSKMMVYPMDTIKKRMQIQSVFGAGAATATAAGAVASASSGAQAQAQAQAPGGAVCNYNYSGMWDCLATTIRTEGVRGLYRGLLPSVLKTTMGSGLSFTFYRTTKNLLESIHDYNLSPITR